MTEPATRPGFATVGDNPVPLWGLSIAERNRRIAGKIAIEEQVDGARLLANASIAFDPEWLRHIGECPGLVVTLDGVPAIGHATDPVCADRLAAAMRAGQPLADNTGFEVVAYESGPTVENKKLRKRETPFLMPLRKDTVRALERASYFGAYKGVTDILTKYLWPEWALVLTRIAARLGMTPNMVTSIGAVLCVAATFAFADGRYWLGMALGLGFMVLDTVDGKLARCTVTSTWWGNIFDHGIDIVHPPFWWWFWATGLAAWGLALDASTFWWTQIAIQGGYVVQRLIEGYFVRRNPKMHIHVWRRFDSRFRLITARRNPNMVILFVSLLFARPDIGIIAVAWWTVISLVVHVVQLVQSEIVHARTGKPLTSWLSEET